MSSRIVTARLLLAKTGQRKPGGSRESKNNYMTVVSVYAPTARAPQGAKQNSQQTCKMYWTGYPSQTPLSCWVISMLELASVSLGRSDLWTGVLGKNGMGDRNRVGEEFLELCATNQLIILNTWFAKKLR